MMSEPEIPPEILAQAAQASPEDFAKWGMLLARCTRASGFLLGVDLAGGSVTTPSEAREAMKNAADVWAEEPRNEQLERSLRFAAREDSLTDADALRFCRESAEKMLNQADALKKTMEVIAAAKREKEKGTSPPQASRPTTTSDHDSQQKSAWWKFWRA